MTVTGYLLAGEPAQLEGDLPERERLDAHALARDFLRHAGVQAGTAGLGSTNYLLIVRDTVSLHFAFAIRASARESTLHHRDAKAMGRLELQAVVQPLREQVGPVAWSFSVPYGNVPPAWTEGYLQTLAGQYRQAQSYL